MHTYISEILGEETSTLLLLFDKVEKHHTV